MAGVASALLAACGGGESLVGRPGLQITDGTVLPAPQNQDLIQQGRSYVVGPSDRVTIDVYGVPDLSRTVNVDASGTIALPLVGVVDAAGKTPTQLAAAVAVKLSRYVRNPQVTVNTETVNQMITVDGEVETPGLYPVLGRMTLMRAVATAKGTTQFAKQNYVVVFRQVGGKDMAALYDLRAIREGAYADPEVFANDVVYVGESGRARLFQALTASGALLTAPLVTVLN